MRKGDQKVMIIAGGTGGHVIPALAVADGLQAKQIKVHWMGTRAGIEAQLVEKAKIPISYIDIQGIRGKKWFFWAWAPWRLAKAFIQSCQVLRKERPGVVLSMGGYVAGPGTLAAWLFRVPCIVHEQNAIPGWTNQILARFATRILTAFPHVFDKKIAKKVIETGNPVREAILQVPPPTIRYPLKETKRLNLLVLGGSLGATKLNELLPKALALLPAEQRPHVWHQTGKNHLAKTKADYAQYPLQDILLVEFIEEMAEAYAWADCVICRSGALTIAELAAVGLPSILIPFPFAINDHQTVNAKYLSDKAAAYLIHQSELSAEVLAQKLQDFISDPQKRLSMAKAAYQLAKPLATQAVVKHCMEVS